MLRVATTDRMALAKVFDIEATQNAAAALRALDDFAAGVLVADIALSERETMAMLSALRDPAASPRRGLPVICLLSESSPERVHQLVRAGVDHVMVKPISAAALRDLAQHLCDNPTAQIAVPNYVGPDRRRLPDEAYGGPDRRGGGDAKPC